MIKNKNLDMDVNIQTKQRIEKSWLKSRIRYFDWFFCFEKSVLS